MNDLDLADALLDAVRLTVAGDVVGAGMKAIPAAEADLILTTSILMNWIATAVRAYALAADIHPPAAAVDRLWSKPARDGR